MAGGGNIDVRIDGSAEGLERAAAESAAALEGMNLELDESKLKMGQMAAVQDIMGKRWSASTQGMIAAEAAFVARCKIVADAGGPAALDTPRPVASEMHPTREGI